MRDKGEFLFTSESVSEGHPDKVADRISDTVLDAYLAADPYARVACETLVTTNRIVLAGETRGPETVTPEYADHLARDGGARYRLRPGRVFLEARAKSSAILHAQSPTSRQGVDSAGNKDEGAGDQGIMFGYACTETEALMPAPLYYAHLILRRSTSCAKGDAGGRPAAGREKPGDAALCRRQAGRRHQHRGVHPARRGHGPGRDQARRAVPLIEASLPEGWMPPRTNSTSTPPAISSSAARTAIAA
jgi:S-adenosylmethionine synthetase